MINIDPPLQRSQSWRGKRYPKGAASIPEDLAIALGLYKPSSEAEQLISKISELGKPPPKDLETLPDADEEEQGEPKQEEQLPALALLNTASSPAELETLPTVGKSTAKAFFEKRPEGGYASLNQAEEIHKDKSHIGWGAIAEWRPEA